jgi:predicted SnoaL-like aldol condensation-catalyzing enzyme
MWARRHVIAIAPKLVISEFGETWTACPRRQFRDVTPNPEDCNMTDPTRQSEAERICRLWDEALGNKDLEASLALYADDASIESPLVQHLMKTPTGIVQGKANLRAFIIRVFQTNPPQRRRFKQGFFTDGRIVTWEYPRVAPDGEQMELVEIMEIDEGLIQRHRVYWGWYALSLLAEH